MYTTTQSQIPHAWKVGRYVILKQYLIISTYLNHVITNNLIIFE